MHGHFGPYEKHPYKVAQIKAQGNNRSKGLPHVSNIIIWRVANVCTSMCFFGGELNVDKRKRERELEIEGESNIHVPDALDDVVNTEPKSYIPLRFLLLRHSKYCAKGDGEI